MKSIRCQESLIWSTLASVEITGEKANYMPRNRKCDLARTAWVFSIFDVQVTVHYSLKTFCYTYQTKSGGGRRRKQLALLASPGKAKLILLTLFMQDALWAKPLPLYKTITAASRMDNYSYIRVNQKKEINVTAHFFIALLLQRSLSETLRTEPWQSHMVYRVPSSTESTLYVWKHNLLFWFRSWLKVKCSLKSYI